MDLEPASAAPALTTAPRGVLADFRAFLRRPAVLAPAGLRAPGALPHWAVITGLQIAGLLLLLPLLHFWQATFKLPSPDAFGQVSPELLPWIVVVIAPLLEELLFRGWQSGRPRALWLLGGSVLLGAVLVTVRPENIGVTGTAALTVAGLTGLGWFLLRKRGVIGWFARGFPVIFYLGAALFALPHLANYPSVSLLALPLVLPQAWAALTLGYLRQRIGLVAAILAHATSNGLMLLAAVVAS